MAHVARDIPWCVYGSVRWCRLWCPSSYEMGERPPLSSVLAEMGLELVCVGVCVRVWPACLLGCPFTVTVKGWRAAWGCGMNGVCKR